MKLPPNTTDPPNPAIALPLHVQCQWRRVGDEELESGWSPARITKTQATELLRILQQHYQSRIGLDLFSALEKRIND